MNKYTSGIYLISKEKYLNGQVEILKVDTTLADTIYATVVKTNLFHDEGDHVSLSLYDADKYYTATKNKELIKILYGN